MAVNNCNMKYLICLCPALFMILIYTFYHAKITPGAAPMICSYFNLTWNGDLTDIEEQLAHFKKMSESRRSSLKTERLLASYQMFIVPQITCATAVRVGKIGDGGKWTCNPWRVPDPCVIYSFGVNEDTSFESDMYSITKKRCKLYSFDFTAQNQKLFDGFNGIFKQWKIMAKTNETKAEWAIVDIAKHFGHDKIDIVKMDIESYELGALPPLLQSDMVSSGKVCQLYIELHNDANLYRTLQIQLEKTGFIMFYKEANTYCHQCHEYSYIHKSCLERYGVRNIVFNSNFD